MCVSSRRTGDMLKWLYVNLIHINTDLGFYIAMKRDGYIFRLELALSTHEIHHKKPMNPLRHQKMCTRKTKVDISCIYINIPRYFCAEQLNFSCNFDPWMLKT